MKKRDGSFISFETIIGFIITGVLSWAGWISLAYIDLSQANAQLNQKVESADKVAIDTNNRVKRVELLLMQGIILKESKLKKDK